MPRVVLRYEQLEDRVMLDAAVAAAPPTALSLAEVERVSIDAVPNDPQFGSMWNLRNTGISGGLADADIDADLAWNRFTGSLGTAVAIIDTGIDYTHPDLYKNLWLNQGELPPGLRLADTDADRLITFWDLNAPSNAGGVIDVNANGRIDGYDVLHDPRWSDGQDNDHNGKIDDLIGWDFVHNDNDPYDDNGHGTHVAGTIGALANNGLGVAGINWKIQMAALKTLDASGGGSTSDAAGALDYAVRQGIRLSNNSWGSGAYSSVLASAIANARAAGHVLVAAAGNDGRNIDTSPYYPAAYRFDNVVAVASTDRYDGLSGFSNYGPTSVDLAAPGSGILSTLRGGGYGLKSGTSMAAPHVTGAIALVWSAYPTLDYRAVISRILGSVDRAAALSGKIATGGRLNVDRALSGAAADTAASHAATTTAAALAFANTTPVALRHRVTVVSSITVPEDVVVGDVNVTLRIAHTNDANLNIYLRAPDGTRVDLIAYRGGNGDDFRGTTLDDQAAVPIASGVAPFAGVYRPEKPLSALQGKLAAGTWKLYVYDRGSSDAGRLESWRLTIVPGQKPTGGAVALATDRVLSCDPDVASGTRWPDRALWELAAALAERRAAEWAPSETPRAIEAHLLDLIYGA
ncbi:MAG: S8 family serine peptidase [Thermoguttaceae bacterium]|jgi:subtilisin family serine protease|nr:S8 family serine peptidase [Thermoguttaceae bacterium]